MKIGEVAELLDMPKQRIHEYEKAGIAFKHDPAHAFEYSEADIERLWMIKFYKELGRTVPEIKKVFTDPAHNKEEALAELIEELKDKRKAIDDMIRRAEFFFSTGLSVHSMTKIIPGLKKSPYKAVTNFYQLYAEVFQATTSESIKQLTIDSKVAQQFKQHCLSYYRQGEAPNSKMVLAAVQEWLNDTGLSFFDVATAVQTEINRSTEGLDPSAEAYLKEVLLSFTQSLESQTNLCIAQIIELAEAATDPNCLEAKKAVFAFLKLIVPSSDLTELKQYLTALTTEEAQDLIDEVKTDFTPWQNSIREKIYSFYYESCYPRSLKEVEKQLKLRSVRTTKQQLAALAEEVTSRVIADDVRSWEKAAEFAWRTIVTYIKSRAEHSTSRINKSKTGG